MSRTWIALPVLALVLAPLAMLLLSWQQVDTVIWSHLSQYVLPRLLSNSLLMVVVVGVGVTALGVSLAWLSACCEFPGRAWLEPLLVLPLAFPPYVLAFVYLGILDFGGPVQGFWRANLGDVPGWLTALRQPGGVLLILILAFYPYVYLLSRASFVSGGLSTFEAGRSLGRSPVEVFLRVTLPAARPAVVAGLALALMETLADFGAVASYGFDTFTTAVYSTWKDQHSLVSAVQLASLLMLFMLLLLLSERFSRGRFRLRQDSRYRPRRLYLTGWKAAAAALFQGAVVLFAVAVPLAQLLVWAWPQFGELFGARYLPLIANTMILSLAGAVLALAAGLLLAAAVSLGRRGNWITDVVGIGYAIPGAVLAVTILLAFNGIDRWLGTALAGGLIALLLAYLVRFLRVAFGPVEAGLERLRPEYRDVARSLGVSGLRRWSRVTLPLLRPGLVTAFLLVLVEIAKEMPATLIMRPFGWDTLAVRIFEFTAEGHWERAAVPAVLLVALGAVPVTLLIRRSRLL